MSAAATATHDDVQGSTLVPAAEVIVAAASFFSPRFAARSLVSKDTVVQRDETMARRLGSS